MSRTLAPKALFAVSIIALGIPTLPLATAQAVSLQGCIDPCQLDPCAPTSISCACLPAIVDCIMAVVYGAACGDHPVFDYIFDPQLVVYDCTHPIGP